MSARGTAVINKVKAISAPNSMIGIVPIRIERVMAFVDASATVAADLISSPNVVNTSTAYAVFDSLNIFHRRL